MNLIYKKIEEKDKEQLFNLMYGAYDGNKLVVMAPLYVSQDMLADFKEEFDYIISMAHSDNIGSCKTLEKVELKFVKETTLSNGFLRKLYMLKLK